LPQHIVLVGGGHIAAEFSHIAARAGARVTVLQRPDRMLPAFDPDLVGWLMEKFDELGIEVRTRSTVRKVEETGNRFAVHALTGDKSQIVDGALVVHAAGRVPDLDAQTLQLAKSRLRMGV
jgi:glutathione reductase (NADPH)